MRMDEVEVEEGLEWLEDRFHVIRYEDDELPSVDWVLDLARAAVLRCWPTLLISSFTNKCITSFGACPSPLVKFTPVPKLCISVQ